MARAGRGRAPVGCAAERLCVTFLRHLSPSRKHLRASPTCVSPGDDVCVAVCGCVCGCACGIVLTLTSCSLCSTSEILVRMPSNSARAWGGRSPAPSLASSPAASRAAVFSGPAASAAGPSSCGDKGLSGKRRHASRCRSTHTFITSATTRSVSVAGSSASPPAPPVPCPCPPELSCTPPRGEVSWADGMPRAHSNSTDTHQEPHGAAQHEQAVPAARLAAQRRFS